jgi:TolB protein
LSGARTALDTVLALPVTESGWYILRAYSDKAIEPVLDIYPFGTTSPIYVIVNKAPIRSEPDARFFLKWIDRIEEGVEAHDGWNSEAEKKGVLDRIAAARHEFEARQ